MRFNAGAWPKVPGSFTAAGGRVWGGAQSWMGTRMHARGVREVANFYGLARNMGKFGRVLGLGFLGWEAYSGYREGGAWGAAKNVGSSAATTYAIGAILGSGAVAGLAVAGAGAMALGGMYAYDQFAKETGRQQAIQHARTEMGSGFVADPFGTAATMRRRSIMALQNSRLNGTMALGNEAALTYRPYWR